MMRIEPGAGQQPVQINTTVKRTDQSSPSIRINSGNSDTVTATAARTNPEYGQLQLINDQQNRVAVQIRQDGQQLDQAGQLLGQMKHELYQITKIYPPYPLDEPARVKFLRSFMGLRQQIDSLTIPPPSKWNGQNFGVAADQSARDIPRQTGDQVPVRQSGSFAVPALPDHASDAEVKAAADQISKVQADIVSRRNALADQADRINQTEGQNAKVDAFGRKIAEQWNFSLPGDAAAEKKSSEVRQEIATNNSVTLTGTPAQLTSLAG
jgi:hypothetical protein